MDRLCRSTTEPSVNLTPIIEGPTPEITLPLGASYGGIGEVKI